MHDRDDGGRGAVADASARRPGGTSTTCSSRARGRDASAARSSRRSRATGGSGACVTESGRTVEGDMVVVGAGVRARHDARRSAPGSRSTTGSSATRGSRRRSRGSSPPATAARYESVDPRPAAAGRALGRGAAAGPARRAGRCSASPSPTARCPTSSATSPTGRASSTSAPPHEWDEVVWRGDRDARRVQRLVPEGRPGPGALAVGRSEDLVHARDADRERGGRVGREGRARGRRFGARRRSGDSRARRLARVRSQHAQSLGTGVIGSTRVSGTRSQGSSP